MKRYLAWIVTAVLCGRLLLRTQAFQTNIMFWDEYDFRSGFFSGADLWTLFARQHGPHRLGLGNLIALALYEVTGWDSTSEAYAGVAAVTLATVICIFVVRRVLGRSSAWDALVPPALLTGLHADAAAGVPHLAYGPLPLLLVMGLAAALLVERLSLRLTLVLIIDFLALFTGYALVLCVLVRVFLLYWLATERRPSYLVALCLSAIAPALFLHGYVLGSGTECAIFPLARPLDYLSFIGLVLTRPFGISGTHGWRIPFVIAASGAMLAAFLVSVRALNAVFLFIGYSLLFAAMTAAGRTCLGTEAAAAPRYVAYVLPALVGLYLAASLWLPAPWRTGALTLLLIAFVSKEVLVTVRPIKETQWLVAGKRAWKECYLRRRDIAACDRETGFAIYPAPERTDLQGKLDYLEERRLNLFR